MAPPFLFGSLATAAAECGGRSGHGCAAPFEVVEAASVGHFDHGHGVHFDPGHAEAMSDHHHHFTEFFADSSSHEVDHTSFLESPSHTLETIPSISGALSSAHEAPDSATSFLESGVPELSPQALALRDTQLRVAFGISGATLLGSLGLCTAIVVKLARRHLAEDESDEEEQSDVDEEAEQHEADLSAGQRAVALAPDRPRISIHNHVVSDKVEKAEDATSFMEANEQGLAYY